MQSQTRFHSYHFTLQVRQEYQEALFQKLKQKTKGQTFIAIKKTKHKLFYEQLKRDMEIVLSYTVGRYRQ